MQEFLTMFQTSITLKIFNINKFESNLSSYYLNVYFLTFIHSNFRTKAFTVIAGFQDIAKFGGI